MKKSNKVTVDDLKFKELYELTVELCSLTPEQCRCSRGSKKRWSDLASIWHSSSDALGCSDIFYAALHAIHWGQYPDGEYSKPLYRLLERVITELAEDGHAYRAWAAMGVFKQALSRILRPQPSEIEGGPSSHSLTTCIYLYHRTNSVVKKGSNADDRNFCNDFECVVKRLVPEAVEWTYQQWSDDRILFCELKSRYGVNYIGKKQEFGRIFSLLRGLWCYDRKPILKEIVELENLTPELALLIWPDRTEEFLIQTFLEAYRKCTPANDYAKELRSSGIYKFVHSCFLEERLAPWNQAKVKRPLYELAVAVD